MTNRDRDELVTVHVDEIRRESEKAILVAIGEEEIWLPKSQLRGDYSEGESDIDVTMTKWIAEQKGIEV